MLVNSKKLLKQARAEQFAVGAFNITSLETALGIIAAAEEEKSPVILAISEKTIDYMGLEVVYAISRSLADKATVPVTIHFDHGRNFPLVWRAVEIGFSSVMLDVSKMDTNKRIPFVKKFAERCHVRNVSVEVEEDVIGGVEDYIKGNDKAKTDPDRAELFAQKTGCDVFAVSIGNRHGKAMPNETLDVELLTKIAEKVSLPLVLHGASSTDPKLTRQVISKGVAKINIDTDLRLAFEKSVRGTLHDTKLYDPRDILKPSIEAVKKTVVEKIRLFGSNNKA